MPSRDHLPRVEGTRLEDVKSAPAENVRNYVRTLSGHLVEDLPAEKAQSHEFLADKLLQVNANEFKAAASPDAPLVFNEKGAGQSELKARFDLIDGPALFEMAGVLHTGAEKYGPDNWRGIEVQDHLNHLIMHVYAYLAGDRSDAHLSHIMCRAMFAQAVVLQDGE